MVFMFVILFLGIKSFFFYSQMKENLSKTPTEPSPAKEHEKKHKEQCIKNKRLSENIYSVANL